MERFGVFLFDIDSASPKICNSELRVPVKDPDGGL